MAPRKELVRAVDFVAESLETMAQSMSQAEGDIFRGVARKYRESGNPKMVLRVWQNEQAAQGFIGPDSAAVRQ